VRVEVSHFLHVGWTNHQSTANGAVAIQVATHLGSERVFRGPGRGQIFSVSKDLIKMTDAFM
jgi:hypothetical protein